MKQTVPDLDLNKPAVRAMVAWQLLALMRERLAADDCAEATRWARAWLTIPQLEGRPAMPLPHVMERQPGDA